MKKFNKYIVNEFKTGFGRFVAIMAIVALGVGFLIGVLQATPDMKSTMSNYYIDNAAYDADVKGTFGLTQENIDAIKNLSSVEAVTPLISTDLLADDGDADVAVRLIGLDAGSLGASGNLNRLTLLEGEWPDAPGEVVAVHGSDQLDEFGVGDTFALDAASGTYQDVYLAEEGADSVTLTVVGVVSSPDYFYGDGREVTTVGSGVINAVLVGRMQDLYDLQKDGSIFSYLSNETLMTVILGSEPIDVVYTDCWVQFADTEEYERFTDSYKNFIADRTAELEEIVDAQLQPFLDLIAAAEERGFGDVLAGMGISADSVDWLILDRASTNVSYVSYDMNVEKVQDIAGVFPIFFIVVAALVALTSMTRMVEEDRMQIGTFKALGYAKGRIMSKYLIFCCLASLIGCVGGVLIGFSLLPTIFWQAYGTMYTLPALQYGFSPWFALAVLVIAIAGTAIVTWAACRTSLKERPAALMQPKAPKAGKRVLIERVGFLWKPLKFKWKATLRNIFRYKRNMLLTIISVMGCTALILTGFGLNDSIVAVSDIQFSEIIRYDASVDYSGDLSATENEALLDLIGEEGKEHISLYSENVQLRFGQDGKQIEGSENVDLYVVENADTFGSFISLHERGNSDQAIDIGAGDGIVLAENLAVVYDVAVGDTVTYRSGTRSVQVRVDAICENYTGSYAYISADAYAELFGEVPASNTLLIKTDVSADDEDVVRAIYSGNTKADGTADAVSVAAVDFTQTSADTFGGLESTMGLVIAVLVVSAGALAAIVLYNLTNINIDERRREIATLRVLGYRKAEVAGYIYRESAILTLVGALLGLGLGFLLHMFIIGRVDSVSMMLGRAIFGWSYLWAFLLTIAFAVIVYAFMLIKLNKVNMAESLKSNE